MSEPHSCLHEEQIMGQSRAIERLGAELEFKKEKLDDLKADNGRMESKIDKLTETIDEKFNDLSEKSDEKDSELNDRLTKIETRLDTQEDNAKKNRDSANLKIAVLGIVLVIIQIYFNFLR